MRKQPSLRKGERALQWWALQQQPVPQPHPAPPVASRAPLEVAWESPPRGSLELEAEARGKGWGEEEHRRTGRKGAREGRHRSPPAGSVLLSAGSLRRAPGSRELGLGGGARPVRSSPPPSSLRQEGGAAGRSSSPLQGVEAGAARLQRRGSRSPSGPTAEARFHRRDSPPDPSAAPLDRGS
jgi:hypothetical protein